MGRSQKIKEAVVPCTGTDGCDIVEHQRRGDGSRAIAYINFCRSVSTGACRTIQIVAVDFEPRSGCSRLTAEYENAILVKIIRRSGIPVRPVMNRVAVNQAARKRGVCVSVANHDTPSNVVYIVA